MQSFKSIILLLPVLGSLSLFSLAPFLPAFAAITTEESVSKEEVSSAGIDTYIYGYPLITMEMTKRVMTNVDRPMNKHAPMGQFSNLREYPTVTDKEVTAPNADTLYSIAWLDLAKEPYILNIPDAQNRYYLLPILDAWTNIFADFGTRTTGTKAQKYAITGPHRVGKLPENIKEYKSPTSLVWIIGRAYCTGTLEDYTKVHAFQDDPSLIPLSAYGKEYIPALGIVDTNIDMNTPVRDQVNQMTAEEYFQLLAQLLKDNPPSYKNAAVVAEMSKIGIVPGQDFDINKLDLETVSSLEGVPKAAQAKIMSHVSKEPLVNGWLKSLGTGVYGDDYLQRAFVTAIGLGANLPQDAIYPISEIDAKGEPYSGSNKYMMHFAAGQIPPVNGFWSLTMYDTKYFFVANPLNRFNLSSRSPFKHNKDGSINIFIQKDSPGKDKEANWLPAPSDKFILMLRMYWPKPEILENKYAIPPVQQIN